MYIAVETATAVLETFILSIYLKGLFQNYTKKMSVVWISYAISGIALCILSLIPSINPFIRLGYGFLSFYILAKLLFGTTWFASLYSALLLTALYIIVDNVCSVSSSCSACPQKPSIHMEITASSISS